MMKQYNLYDMSKTKELAFSLNMQELDENVPVHIHDCTELVIILSGKATHLIDDEEYELKTGDVFVANINSDHGYKDVRHLKLCNLMFDFDRLVEADNELQQLPGFQSLFILEPYFRKEQRFESKLELNPLSLSFVKEFLAIMEKEYEDCVSGFKPAIRTYFLTLLVYLSRQYSAGKSKASGKLFNIANAIAYMENNFLYPVSISSVAAISYLSTRQFVRIFKSNYNVSPKEYIIGLRLDHACRLMHEGNTKLSQVAMESGFSDTSHFSRLFKAKFGISPGEFRKR
jgi:AraC-like DNA-binding protein